MEQRSEEWFEARKGRVTASMVGAILGVSPNLSRAGAMRRMVREREGAPAEFTGNIATDYGEANEEGAVAEYYLETGNRVDKVGFVTKEDWAGCSPDGLIGSDGGLEAKCPFGKRKEGELNPLEDVDNEEYGLGPEYDSIRDDEKESPSSGYAFLERLDAFSLTGLVQAVPAIILLTLIAALLLTFVTEIVPEFPGALASSILTVTLIIYGAARLLKA